jgi:hypothetical protein
MSNNKKFNERLKVLKELLETERTYVNGLNLLGFFNIFLNFNIFF